MAIYHRRVKGKRPAQPAGTPTDSAPVVMCPPRNPRRAARRKRQRPPARRCPVRPSTCPGPTCGGSTNSCPLTPTPLTTKENRTMSTSTSTGTTTGTTSPSRGLLLRHNLKALKLPTMLAEHEKLAREASEANEDYQGYLLRLSELELATRSGNALAGRIKLAGFPVVKELADFDFTLAPTVNKPKVLELAKGEWVGRHETACFLGNSGTGKTHLATAVGLCACRAGRRVRFCTAAALANQLDEAQKQYRLERALKQLDRAELLIIDELGYLSFNRTAAELLFQVF